MPRGLINGERARKTTSVDAAQLVAAARAKELLELRRRRDSLFGGELFGEPAWDLLLELFIAGVEGRLMPTKSACIATGAPMSTALRWISRLVDEGMIRRCRRGEGKRFLLALDETVAQAVQDMLLQRM